MKSFKLKKFHHEKKKEDFYIAMLRFGKSKMEDGFRLPELGTHLKGKNYFVSSEHSTLLHHYFPLTFYSKEIEPYPDTVSFYFRRPESYFHLLNYDSVLESRKRATEARLFAIAAILVSILAMVFT